MYNLPSHKLNRILCKMYFLPGVENIDEKKILQTIKVALLTINSIKPN